MSEIFKYMLSACGFTQQTASDYLTQTLGRNISKDTIKAFMRGKSHINADVISCLSEYYEKIEDAKTSKKINDLHKSANTSDTALTENLSVIEMKALALMKLSRA